MQTVIEGEDALVSAGAHSDGTNDLVTLLIVAVHIGDPLDEAHGGHSHHKTVN